MNQHNNSPKLPIKQNNGKFFKTLNVRQYVSNYKQAQNYFLAKPHSFALLKGG